MELFVQQLCHGCCFVTMLLCINIGITCISVLGNFFPATEATPIGSSFGSPSSFRPNSEQHAEFGEGIRDWFKGVRNRVFGGGGTNSQVLPPIEAGKMMMELENEDLQDQKRNPGGFFLDLSNLKFDPTTDWGFRLGQWYFIRKPSTMTTPNNDWKSSQPTYPEWPIMENGRDDNMVPPLITMKPNAVMTTIATIPSKESPEVTEPEVPKVKNQSTEVLLPAEKKI